LTLVGHRVGLLLIIGLPRAQLLWASVFPKFKYRYYFINYPSIESQPLLKGPIDFGLPPRKDRPDHRDGAKFPLLLMKFCHLKHICNL
jgi:hypothetical protein